MNVMPELTIANVMASVTLLMAPSVVHAKVALGEIEQTFKVSRNYSINAEVIFPRFRTSEEILISLSYLSYLCVGCQPFVNYYQ